MEEVTMHKKKIKKECTFMSYFLRYFMNLIVAIILTTITIFILITSSSISYPANYTEQMIHENIAYYAGADDIEKVTMPPYTTYAVVDEKGRQLIGTMDAKFSNDLQIIVKDKRNVYKNYYYMYAQRPEGTLILQYQIRSHYKNEILDNILPNPELLLLAILFFFILLEIIICGYFFSKKLRLELLPVQKATEKLLDDDLNFIIEHTEIKEYNEILLGIDRVKTDLQLSLKNQWDAERNQKEQIAALVHDLKTPLTVAIGNVELLEDEQLGEESEQYVVRLKNSVEQIEKYIKTLQSISLEEHAIYMPKKIRLTPFIDAVIDDARAHAVLKEVRVQADITSLPQYFFFDEILIYRALQNVLSNAIRFATSKGIVKITVNYDETETNSWLSFLIEDSGKGFSEESKKNAIKQFYMEDSSRASNEHFGMGLYTTKQIMDMHQGIIMIDDSTLLTGASVKLSIPNG